MSKWHVIYWHKLCMVIGLLLFKTWTIRHFLMIIFKVSVNLLVFCTHFVHRLFAPQNWLTHCRKLIACKSQSHCQQNSQRKPHENFKVYFEKNISSHLYDHLQRIDCANFCTRNVIFNHHFIAFTIDKVYFCYYKWLNMAVINCGLFSLFLSRCVSLGWLFIYYYHDILYHKSCDREYSYRLI